MNTPEGERIDALITKLGHVLPDVRIRAAKNLLLKFQTGLVDRILDSPNVLKSFSDSFHDSIKRFILPTILEPTINSLDAIFFKLLFQLITHIGPNLSTLTSSKVAYNGGVGERILPLVNVLSQIHSNDDINESNRQIVKKAIDSLCSMPVRKKEEFTQIYHKENITNNIVNKVSKSIQKTSITYASKVFLREQQELPLSIRDGFTNILKSPLTLTGWKFPQLELTESDIRYFFDLEVRLKLAKDNCQLALLQTLVDFPAPILLQRPLLLEVIFHIAGSTVTSDFTSSLYHNITPAFTIHWLEMLFKNCIRSYKILLDGSLCSTLVNKENQIDDGEDGSTLANRMARSFSAMKYPAVSLLPENTELYEIEHYSPPPPTTTTANDGLETYEASYDKSAGYSNPTHSPHSYPNLPITRVSLSGFAFAVITVSLEILRSRDVDSSDSALSLCLAALPYLLEPASRDFSGDSFPTLSCQDQQRYCSNVRLSAVDFGRLHHILNLLEQVLLATQLEPASLQNTLILLSSFDGSSNSNKEEASATSSTSISFKGFALDATILRVTFEILLRIPLTALSNTDTTTTTSENSNVTSKTRKGISELILPNKITAILFEFCATDSLRSLFPTYLVNYLDSIVKVSNIGVYEAQSLAKEALISVSKLRRRGLLEKTSPVALLQDVKLVVCVLLSLSCSTWLKSDNNSSMNTNGEGDSVSDSVLLAGGELEDPLVVVTAAAVWCAGIHDTNIPTAAETETVASAEAEAVPGRDGLMTSSHGETDTASGIFSHLICCVKVTSRIICLQKLLVLLQVDSDESNKLRLLRSLGFLGPSPTDTADHSLVAALCSPDFIQRLLLSGCLHAEIAEERTKLVVKMEGNKRDDDNDTDTLTETQRQLKHLSYELLEALFRFANIHISSLLDPTNDNAGKWRRLLPLLKLVVWNLEPSSSSSSTPTPEQYNSIRIFSDRLEDFVASNTYEGRYDDVDILGRIRVFGLFHRNSQIRGRSALLLLHELGYDTSAWSAVSVDPFRTSASVSTNGEREVDYAIISDSVGAIRLDEWSLDRDDPVNGTASTSKNNPRNTMTSEYYTAKNVSGSSFSHSDVHRIAVIITGTDHSSNGTKGGMEERIRATAAKQLIDILQNDNLLLETEDAEWCITFAISLLDIIKSETSSDPLAVMSAKLLYLLVSRVSAVRQAMRCYRRTDKSEELHEKEVVDVRPFAKGIDIDISPLLGIVLLPTHSAHARSIHVRSLCAEMLWVLALTPTTWGIEEHRRKSPQPLTNDTSFPLLRWSRSCHRIGSKGPILEIPLFLKAHCLLMRRQSHPAAAGDYTASASPCSLPVVTLTLQLCDRYTNAYFNNHKNISSQYFQQAIIKEIENVKFRELLANNNDDDNINEPFYRIYENLGNKLHEEIVQSRGHRELRSALVAVKCLLRNFRSLATVFLRSSFISSFDRLLQTSPTSASDFVTLTVALPLLRLLVDEEAKSPLLMSAVKSRESRLSFSEYLLSVMCTTFRPLLECHGMHASQSAVDGRDAVSSAALLQHTQSEILLLFASLCGSGITSLFERQPLLASSPSTPHTATQGFLANISSSVTLLLLKIVCTECQPYWIRLQAAIIIERVLTSSEDLRSILCQPTASLQNTTLITHSQRTPLEELCQLIRLFRIPDSLRGSALVISCLRIIIVCLQDNKLLFEFLQTDKEIGQVNIIDNKIHPLQKWGWVTKLCHDRRGEIRILALQLLELLVAHTEMNHKITDSTHTSNPVHENTNFDDCSPMTSDYRTAWPPIHSLNQLVQDELESPVVRSKAIEIIIKISFNNKLTQNKSLILFLYNTLPTHKKLYSTLTTLLQSIVLKNNNHIKKYTQTNSYALRTILNLFLLLLNSTLLVTIKMKENYSQELNPFSNDENEELIAVLIKEYFDCIKVNKILPLFIEILNPQIKQMFYYKTLQRIGQTIPVTQTNNNDNNNDNTEGSHQNYYDSNIGWNMVSKEYFQVEVQQIEDAQRYVSQFLSMVFEADLRCRHPNSSSLLQDALQHSQIFSHVMELIHLPGSQAAASYTSIHSKENNLKVEDKVYLGYTASYIAHSELLSLILRQSYDASPSAPAAAVPSDSPSMTDKKSVLLTLLTGFQNNTRNNPLQIWKSFTQRLQLLFIFLRKDDPKVCTASSEIEIYFKLNELRCTLRLVGALLMIPEWTQIIRNSFAVNNNGFIVSNPGRSLLPVLSQFLINTEDFLHISNMDVYLSMIATTLGLLLEKIPEYRSLLKHEIPVNQDRHTHNNSSSSSSNTGKELLQSVLDKILSQDINWIDILQHQLTVVKKKQTNPPDPLTANQSIYSTSSIPSTTSPPLHPSPNTTPTTGIPINDKKISPVNQIESKSLSTRKAFPATPSGKSPLSLLKGTTMSGHKPLGRNGSNNKNANELNNNNNNSSNNRSSSAAVPGRVTKGKVTERKWRTKARSYVINESSIRQSSSTVDQTENILSTGDAGANALYSTAYENHSLKVSPSLKGLWNSLIVLLSVIPENTSYIHYALSYHSNQLASLLCNIVRTTVTTSYLTKGANNAYPSSSTKDHPLNKRITFSRGDDSYYLQSILFTTLSLLSVLSKDSDEETKRMLITCTSSAQSKISLLDTDRSVSASIQRKVKQNEVSFGVGSGGGPLAQLTAITLSPGSDVAVRWLCLAVVGNIVSGDVKMQSVLSEGLLGQKIVALGCILKNAIQKEFLANASRIAGFQMFLCTCLEVLTSCIVVEVSRHGAATLLHDEKSSAVESISFPDLMEWLWLHRSSGHPDISLAIVKCVGVVAISAGAQAGVSKKFFVNIVNEKILLILLRALDHRAYHPVVSYNACISLYNIFHDSEQARATAKAIIESSSTVLEIFSSHQHDFQLTSLLSVVGNYLK